MLWLHGGHPAFMSCSSTASQWGLPNKHMHVAGRVGLFRCCPMQMYRGCPNQQNHLPC